MKKSLFSTIFVFFLGCAFAGCQTEEPEQEPEVDPTPEPDTTMVVIVDEPEETTTYEATIVGGERDTVQHTP